MNSTIYYKLTDKNNKTKNDTLWGENVTHGAHGDNPELCSSSWIHFYQCPLIAVLMNPIHANFTSPHLWTCSIAGQVKHELLKSGCKSLTTLEIIELPKITAKQATAFGILCAKQCYTEKNWVMWADNWLSDKDRSASSAAYAAASSAASAAFYAADYAADYAAHAAAEVASPAYAAYAARAASTSSVMPLDFSKLAKDCLQYA